MIQCDVYEVVIGWPWDIIQHVLFFLLKAKTQNTNVVMLECFMTCSAHFNIWSEGSIAELSNVVGR